MRISELLDILTDIEQTHGDLPIVGGYLSPDETPRTVEILNANGGLYDPNNAVPIDGVYISS